MNKPEAPLLRVLGPPRWGREAGEPLLRVERPSQLLCLLACCREWVAREQLAEWLWPERSQAQALTNLRTALLRAERVARGVPIERQAHYLRWLPETDLQQFEASLAGSLHPPPLPGVLLQGMDVGLGPGALEWLEAERQRLFSAWQAAAGERAAPEELPPLRSEDTGLLGRRHEAAQLRELLADANTRIVTVLGPGGIGKTVLARRAAPVPSVWVALDACIDESQVPGAVAAALGRELAAGFEPWLALRLLLGAAPLCVVLDGVEHLSALPARLHDWLAGCPGLKLLLTSRHRLGLAEEQLLPLEGLPLPDEDEREAEVLEHNDAIRLFCARARTLAPDFRLAGNVAPLVRLMHAVGGMPLAIELAAAWVRLLPLAELADRIEASIDTLARPAAAAGRDVSVRACFDRSWQLLSLEDRHTIALLAALPLPADADMALQTAHAGLPKLAALVDHSMLTAESGGFHMHPLIRQYALQTEEGQRVDRPALMARHLARMDAVLARHADFNFGDPRPALAELQRHLHHLRAAWRNATAQRDTAFLARHALTLAAYFSYCGGQHQEAGMVDEAVTACGADAPAALLLAGAQVLFRAARLEAAEAMARRALRRARLEKNTRWVARSLNALALAIGGRGEAGTVQAFLQQGLRIARQHQHGHEAGQLLASLARLAKAEGRWAEAEALFRESLAMAGQGPVPNHEGVALQTNNLANLYAAQDDWARAVPLFEQAATHARSFGIRIHGALLHGNLARAQRALGQGDAALREVALARQMARDHGRPLLELHARLTEIRILVDGQAFERSRSLLLEAFALAALLGLPAERARCVLAYAWHEAGRGARARARALLAWGRTVDSLPADEWAEIERSLAALGAASEAAADAPDAVRDAAPDAALEAAAAAVQTELAAAAGR